VTKLVNSKLFDSKMLDEILRETIGNIEKSKMQMFDIAESARKECERIKNELQKVQKETLDIIDKVDRIEKLEYKARNHLAHVSSHFKDFEEVIIKKAYEEAYNIQLKL
jgi:two-component system sensor histidine kinase DegS